MAGVSARSVTRRAVLAGTAGAAVLTGAGIGRVRTRITLDELQADFQVVPVVSQPGAPVQTRASFVVPDRDPTLHPAGVGSSSRAANLPQRGR